MRDLKQAADLLGCRIEIVTAANESQLEGAFAGMAGKGAQAMIVSTDPFFFGVRGRVTELAARHALPAIYDFREYVAAGGLMSYGTNLIVVYQQLGIYTGKILAGAKPADLPVVQPTKFDLLINLRTARSLGIEVPPTLLALADEVIE
jgi:putative tryptophan/tyrosine transport system substrate-binding protein